MKFTEYGSIILGVLATLLFGFLILVSFCTLGWSSDIGKHVHGLIVNFAFALLSIAGTVLIVDRLNEARDSEEERRRLVRDMAATDVSIATRGARELAEKGALSNGYLNGRDLSGAVLDRAGLQGLVITDGMLVGVRLVHADLSQANLVRSVLNSSDLENATLEGAVLHGCECVGTKFDNADMDGADLSDGNFKSATFVGSDLSGADMRGANFLGADFTNCTFESTKCKGARFDHKFAVKHGMDNFEKHDDEYLCKLEIL